MTLSGGARLGPYEILSPLGAGGMGEVYRAKDPRLGREVAVKVLSASFSKDPDRLRRFEQEARAAGVLNHPNITAVYDIGTHEGAPYVVSELLEGETLRSRLAGGLLPQRKAIDYAIQIAHGLSAAHEKGIVHRDLKPENLFVTKDGRVKILDFGLAKLTQPALPSLSLTEAPTVVPSTDVGIVLGTVGYMSPEQVLGKPLDARSDLFSLGVVLYEMLSGKRPFQKDNAPETMAAILKEEPLDLAESVGNIPPGLDRIVRHCLEKDPTSRFQTAHDVAFGLETSTYISGLSKPVPALPSKRRASRLLALLTSAAAILLITLGLGFLLGRHAALPEPPFFQRLTWRRGDVVSARFAPDGQTVLYSASWDGKPPAIFLKRPESPDAVPLDLPGANLLAVSSSGEMAIQLNRLETDVGLTGGTLARVALTGGAPREMAENVNQGDWGPDGSLVVARDVAGKSRLEYPLGKVLYETAGRVSFPRFSSRGDLIAFVDHPLKGDDRGAVAVIDLQGEKRTLSKEFESVYGLAWSPSGGELWFTAATAGLSHSLWGVTLSGKQRAFSRVPGDVRLLDVTRSGRVLLTRGELRSGVWWLPPGETRERELSWFGWSGLVNLSPDGRTIVFGEGGEPAGPNYAVCLWRANSAPVRLGDGAPGAISPDGKWVISHLPKPGAPIVLLPTGAGEAKTIDSRGLAFGGAPAAWLPDGKRLLLVGREKGRGLLRLFVQSLDGENPRPISPEGVPSAIGYQIAISPDGDFVAASGPDQKVALYPVNGGEPRPVAGAAEDDIPLQWSEDGRSLYVRQRRELYSPARVFRLDLKTGKREFWKDFSPADSAGVVSTDTVCLTPDGRSYAYDYTQALSDLYLVEGLR